MGFSLSLTHLVWDGCYEKEVHTSYTNFDYDYDLFIFGDYDYEVYYFENTSFICGMREMRPVFKYLVFSMLITCAVSIVTLNTCIVVKVWKQVGCHKKISISISCFSLF
jgi:hypothetical protein